MQSIEHNYCGDNSAIFKLKLNPCTNLGVLVQVYPTGLLFMWNDLIRGTVEQKLVFENRIS